MPPVFDVFFPYPITTTIVGKFLADLIIMIRMVIVMVVVMMVVVVMLNLLPLCLRQAVRLQPQHGTLRCAIVVSIANMSSLPHIPLPALGVVVLPLRWMLRLWRRSLLWRHTLR
jgi:hypothetical protein